MDPVHERLVRRLRQLAEARGIVFSHLPHRAGVGETHFWAVVKGGSSPTLRWMCAMADALGVDVAELLTPPAPPYPDARGG